MTRTHALRSLLEHGPLTWRELREITGWPEGALKCAVARLIEYGSIDVQPIGKHANLYRLS
jgi:DNA-binding MarR family transcriptional regulator